MNRKFSTLLNLFILFAVLFLVVPAIHAQGDVVVPFGSGGLDMLFHDIAQGLAVQFAKVIVPFAGPMIALLVNLLKPITNMNFKVFGKPAFIHANVLSFALSVIVGIGFMIFTEMGYGGQFETVVSTISTVSAAILSIMGTQVVASATYKVAKAQAIPIIGYSRIKTPAVVPLNHAA